MGFAKLKIPTIKGGLGLLSQLSEENGICQGEMKLQGIVNFSPCGNFVMKK